MFNHSYGWSVPGLRVLARKTSNSEKNRLNSQSCSGFSYIEVLLSLAIFSVGILGFAHVQVFNARLANESLLSAHAGLLLESAREQVMAVGQLVDADRWQENVQKSLPEGELGINESPEFSELGISWKSLFGQDEEKHIYQLTVTNVNIDG